jgi:hypothetical protein
MKCLLCFIYSYTGVGEGDLTLRQDTKLVTKFHPTHMGWGHKKKVKRYTNTEKIIGSMVSDLDITISYNTNNYGQ